MKDMLTTDQPKSNKRNKFIIIFSVVTIFGFIPWSLLSLEIKDSTLAMLMQGTIGISGLFVLICTLISQIINYNNWISKCVTLLCFIILIPLGFVWLISLLGPAQWQDLKIYRNGKEYLIVEGITYGRDGIKMDYRLIRTYYLDSKIRYFEELHKLKNIEDRFSADEVTHNGKVWKQQKIQYINSGS